MTGVQTCALPISSYEKFGLKSVPFPYKVTTICFVGPSAFAPVHSAITLFPEEFASRVTKRKSIPVTAGVSA